MNKIVKRQLVKGEDAHGYYPIDPCVICDVLDGFTINSACDRIMDFGAGKGSGLLALEACGFTKLAGIEYTEQLYYCMRDNFELLGWNCIKSQDEFSLDDSLQILTILGDAGGLEFELDSFNWFYFFNPFGTLVFEKVIDNICRSLYRRKRKVRIVYGEPMCHKIVINSGMFKQVKESRIDFYNGVMWFRVYESEN